VSQILCPDPPDTLSLARRAAVFNVHA
jgi:hypothetical protein